jgi:signal transduction histidine kinase
MNIQAESGNRNALTVKCLNGHGIDAELAGNMKQPTLVALFQRGFVGLAESHRRWKISRAADSKLGAEIRRSAEFVAVLSHELRNSLGAISNAAHLLRMEVSPAPAVVKARLLLERQVLQMSRLVEDFLDVSRIRSGQLRLQRARIDLSVAVAHSVATVEFATQQRNHRVTVSLPEKPVWVHADSMRLEQVFVNLLVNAAKYTDGGGQIAVSVEQGERSAIVRVLDTGIGIAPEVLPNVFDLFVQADPSSRRADGGLGIGLALVRSLVDSHGGRVTAHSAGLGKGSEFTVHLPTFEES